MQRLYLREYLIDIFARVVVTVCQQLTVRNLFAEVQNDVPSLRIKYSSVVILNKLSVRAFYCSFIVYWNYM
jgi:hypothetical protein